MSPMSDPAESMAAPNVPLPPILRAEPAGPTLARRPWYRSIAPAYLGIFVWAPFFDRLWAGDLPRSDLPWLFGIAAAASVLCFGMFYPAVSWGLAARRPLGIVAASSFGTLGSEWITGIAIAVANIVWYAVAIDFAVDSILLGLRACGLISPVVLAGWHLGAVDVKSPVYLCTALFWIYITGTAGLLRLTGVIGALMRVYAPIAMLLLTAVALWLLPGLVSYSREDAVTIAENAGFLDSRRGHDSALQMILGFFAMASLTSVDWGARVRGRRDLVLGGLTGIVVAASWTAWMSLVVVAGAIARISHQGGWFAERDDPFRLSFRWAVFHGIGGVPAGAILILFGLAALAPACYSVSVYGEKLSIHWPRLRQLGWTWIGGAVAFALAATSNASRLELIFTAMGDLFAPAAGAIAGDWLSQRGDWSGLRQGVNRAGAIAWGAGFGVALALEVDRVFDPASAQWWQPTAICGFVTSLVVYWLLARLGRVRPTVALSQREIGQ
ncbi:MAG: hypothetical protein ACHRXM_25535 [Isosphaerales bacterium]